MEHPPEALRAFLPLSQSFALRAGGHRQRTQAERRIRGLAALARRLWAGSRRFQRAGTEHPPEALRAFPWLSRSFALRAGEHRQRTQAERRIRGLAGLALRLWLGSRQLQRLRMTLSAAES